MAFTEVIKYEGDNEKLIWKHPVEDFNSSTQLIVHESQEAIFFLNGQALDLFGAGRYTLETENIPLLRRALNFVTKNTVSPFHAEVYFVNLTEKMNLNWGTDTKINYIDPINNNYVFPLGAHGTMSITVSDSRKLLVKLVGTEAVLDNNKLVEYFKGPIRTYVKSFLPNVLKQRGISIFEIDEHLMDFSKDMQQLLEQEFLDYGIGLQKFWINSFDKPENDPYYRKIIELRGLELTGVKEANVKQDIELVNHDTFAKRQRMDVDTERYKQEQLGYTYQQGRSFDVAEAMAKNEGEGAGLRNGMMNMGMGMGAMGAVAGMSRDLMDTALNKHLMTPPDRTHTKVHEENTEEYQEIPGLVRLKSEEVSGHQNELVQLENKVHKLVIMHNEGLLSDEEFLEEKRKILKNM